MADALLKLTSNFEAWISKQPSRIAKQARFAGMQALNDAATQVKAETLKDMGYAFDRPTPWTMRGLYIQYAKRDSLTAMVHVNGALTNKQGRAQINTLRPHFEGGTRERKAFERAFQRANLMPEGWFAVPGSAASSLGVIDAYGNLKRSFLVQLLSYFQTFDRAGYRMNMTAKRKASLAKRGKSADGYSQINGVVYFISTKWEVIGAGAWKRGRVNHLAPGVWAKTGVHGADVKPVIMFVSSTHYKRRVFLPSNAHQVMDSQFRALFAARYRTALATSK
jgi:hypothetical protein